MSPTRYVPEVLPVGFPDDLPRRIALWNSSFKLDFFTVRARLEALARESWHAVRGATVLEIEALPAVTENILRGESAVICFVDDDDWFAPQLHMELAKHELASCDAVRWEGPLFNGTLHARFLPPFMAKSAVRGFRAVSANARLAGAYSRIVRWTCKATEIPVHPADLLFMTNNYGLTSKCARTLRGYHEVADHVEASRLFLRSRLRIKTLPQYWLSMTNKHPCSAGVIGHVTSRTDPVEALQRWVSAFVEDAAKLTPPPALRWSLPYIAQTRAIFAEAIR